MRWQMMPTGWRRSLLAVLVGVLVGVLLLAGCGTTGQNPDLQAENPFNILPTVFDTPQRPEDRLPDDFEFAELDRSTTRLLAERDDPPRAVWVGLRTGGGQVCLVNAIAPGTANFAAGMGCASLVDFQTHGLHVKVSTNTSHSLVVLFPSGYAESIRAQLPAGDVTENLVLFDQVTRASLPDTVLTVSPDPGADAALGPLDLIIPR